MRTVAEINYAFTPVAKLSEIQRSAMLKTEIAFKELATDIADLVPECPDRTAALRKLLEAKMTCTQAITHATPFGVAQVPSPEPIEIPKKEVKNGKNKAS